MDKYNFNYKYLNKKDKRAFTILWFRFKRFSN